MPGIVNRVLLSIALLFSGAIALAQSTLEEQTGNVQSQLHESEQSSETQAGENNSAVELTDVSNQNLVSANALIAQTGNTVMTAGTCLVIDDIVRQFCNANPNDISCQFQ